MLYDLGFLGEVLYVLMRSSFFYFSLLFNIIMALDNRQKCVYAQNDVI